MKYRVSATAAISLLLVLVPLMAVRTLPGQDKLEVKTVDGAKHVLNPSKPIKSG
jgi:hypothetical protein